MEFRRFAHSAAPAQPRSQHAAGTALVVGGMGLGLDSLVRDGITFIIPGKEEAPTPPRRRQPWGGEIPTGPGWQQESQGIEIPKSGVDAL